VLRFNDTNIERAIAPLLSRLRGRRALAIAVDENDFASQLRHRFDSVESLQLTDGNGPESASAALTNGLELESDSMDLVALYWSFHHMEKRALALREILRVLRPQGRIAVIDGIPLAGSERQYTHLMLQQLMVEWRAALGGPSFPILSAEEMQRELKAAGFHHLRVHEFLQTVSVPAGEAERKEQSLKILRRDIIPSLARLGARRAEFEKRVVEIKQRIERVGIEMHPFVVVTGMKKLTTSRAQPTLFAGDTANTAVAAKLESRYEFHSDLEEGMPSLEERLLKFGPSSLRVPELLAFLLNPGQPESTRGLAERILHDYGSRAIAEERNPYRLRDTLDVSLSVACQLISLFELGRRFFEKSKVPTLRSPEDVFNHLREMGTLKREHFRMMFLNPQSELLGDEVIAIGNRNAAQLHPREVFQRAAQYRASALILCHNHPSGDANPSSEDLELTRRLAEASKIMGMELLDHIIVAGQTWMSLRDAGLL
jgi:DNA repair protein RadC